MKPNFRACLLAAALLGAGGHAASDDSRARKIDRSLKKTVRELIEPAKSISGEGEPGGPRGANLGALRGPASDAKAPPAQRLDAMLAAGGILGGVRFIPPAVLADSSRRAGIIFVGDSPRQAVNADQPAEDQLDGFIRSIKENLERYQFVADSFDPANPVFRDMVLDRKSRMRILAWARSCSGKVDPDCSRLAALKGIFRYRKGATVPMEVIDEIFEGVSQEERYKMLAGNVIDFFGLQETFEDPLAEATG